MNKLEQTKFSAKNKFHKLQKYKKKKLSKAVFATKPLKFRVYIQEIVTSE